MDKLGLNELVKPKRLPRGFLDGHVEEIVEAVRKSSMAAVARAITERTGFPCSGMAIHALLTRRGLIAKAKRRMPR